jgi:Uma2 family endonuclease
LSAPQSNPATYADLEKVPPHLVAELIDGALVTHPRPAPRHAIAGTNLGMELGLPFQKGRGGPGGWVFVDEPELHFGADVVVPDIAAWRVERFPGVPKTAYFEVSPDWACEIMSPSTIRYDRGAKRIIYARAGVSFLWLLDPVEQVLEAFALVGEQWLLAGTATGAEDVRLPPFEAISFPLSNLFPFDAPKSSEPTA